MRNSVQNSAPNQEEGQSGADDDRVSRNTVVPTAPYPPMNFPSAAPSKSSLSSSPHYSTTYGRASSPASLVGDRVLATMIAPESGLLGDASAATFAGAMTGSAKTDDGNSSFSSGAKHYGKSSGVGSNNTNSSNVNGTAAGTANPSQIMFCPGRHDMIASINCVSSLKNKTEPSAQRLYRGDNSNSNNSINSKLGGSSIADTNGPVMLELRRLEVAIKQEDGSGSDEGLDSGSSFFTTRTIAVSRGNPHLGSIRSTCMDLPSPSIVKNYDSGRDSLMAITGSTTGALCVHKFHGSDTVAAFDDPHNNSTEETSGGNNDEYLFSASPIDYFHTPRHYRKASAVACRPTIQTSHVAVGLGNSQATASGSMNSSNQHHQLHRRSATISMRSGGSDREYCCFVWDVVDSKRNTPLSKLAFNSPVASLAWMMDGQTLAIGGQQRTIQLYDLRLPTNNNNKLPPLSAYAHESGVHGIASDPHRAHIMATFCRSVGEPVKLFDIRRMGSVLSEIKLTNTDSHNTGSSTASMPTSIASQRTQHAKAEAIQWSILEHGMLSIATGESVQEYDTNSGARPNLVRVNRVGKTGKAIKAIALYRGKEENESNNTYTDNSSNVGSGPTDTMGKEKGRNMKDNSDQLLSRLYPQRLLAVLEDQTIEDMAKGTNAPLAISHRDGRLFHALGPHLFMGTSGEGPSAMEKVIERGQMTKVYEEEDISATMMRRARCLQANPYSMNPETNMKLMSRETLNEENSDHQENEPSFSMLPKYNNRGLLRLWGWIERVESLSFQEVDSAEEELKVTKEISNAGVLQLLTAQRNEGKGSVAEEQTVFSETLSCNIYDSAARRAALSSCGWAGKFDLSIVMAECEALGEYERSAALAVWHEDVGAAVDALQRGSEAIRRERHEGEISFSFPVNSQYAELLDLISMCIAGFGGKTEAQRGVWSRACASLVQRDDLSSTKAKENTRIAYLRGLCEFLMNAGTVESLLKVLENSRLSLCDRVAFACRFLEKRELTTYLLRCVEICQELGNLEGLSITGLSKPGIKILQSFVDRYTDVQTAALVVSRVILPADWASERKICFEWVESYRNLLNLWQMWQSRAMFDVDRADVLRRFKARNGGSGNQRRMQNPRARQSPRPPDPDILPRIPAQLEARCNYCSAPLSLKKQEGITNQWLSKMQPMLNCCAQCRKPLPRCSICLLSMGSLNPYMELTRPRQGPRGGGKNLPSSDDLSSLSSMNFSEWYTWCMRCRHGGHAHHIVGWFSSQKVCPVSGCDCECEFDGAIKISRPAICVEADN